MSQSDLNVANASGAVVRADMNAHFDALASQNSGAVEPVTKFPNQWWMDTSVNILKQRDAANTAWISTASKITTNWVPFRNGIVTGEASVRNVGVVLANEVPDTVLVQRAAFATVLAGGTANVITLSYTPTLTALTLYHPFRFEAAFTNTAAVTINPDGLGAKSVVKIGGTTLLEPQDLVVGGIYTGIFDGTFIQIIDGISPPVSTGSLKSVQVLTATTTWTRPAGIGLVIAEVVGGGGSGGGTNGTGTSGAGGGGGGYSRVLVDVTAIPSVAVTVGGISGTSSFGGHATASGGQLGGNHPSNGGLGGIGTSGQINLTGQGGGGSGAASADQSRSGVGGSSHLGGGGAGHGSNTFGNGISGGPFGGGGSGASRTVSGDGVGGLGAAGVVIVWEYT